MRLPLSQRQPHHYPDCCVPSSSRSHISLSSSLPLSSLHLAFALSLLDHSTPSLESLFPPSSCSSSFIPLLEHATLVLHSAGPVSSSPAAFEKQTPQSSSIPAVLTLSCKIYIMRPTTISLALHALLAAPAAAFWRMSCPSRLVQERADPLIAPGAVSAHVHTIAGGNGFGFNISYDQLRASTCSSCSIQQDLSAYWTPALFYEAQNGSFYRVPQAGDTAGYEGGMTVYYLYDSNSTSL